MAELRPRVSVAVRSALRCPDCGSVLGEANAAAVCTRCQLHYPVTGAGAIDLRLKRPKTCHLPLTLGKRFPPDGVPLVEPLKMNPHPEVAFGDMAVPHHMTAELRSYLPKASSSGSLMLDLACGDGVHRTMCERAGFEWVGADYDEHSQAAVLADAHSLPFADASFECVLCVAAIHLFQFPLVAMGEVRRVLKPGGMFLGTVAFLEPFHDGGFYHHTHLGVLNSLSCAGLRVEVLAPSEDWSVLVAQANMALFPKMPPFMSRAVVYPVQMLHRLWWAVGRHVSRNPNASNSVRIRNTTAAFAFVARRTASGEVPVDAGCQPANAGPS